MIYSALTIGSLRLVDTRVNKLDTPQTSCRPLSTPPIALKRISLGEPPRSRGYEITGTGSRPQPLFGIPLTDGQRHRFWGSRRGRSGRLPRRDDELLDPDTRGSALQPDRGALRSGEEWM